MPKYHLNDWYGDPRHFTEETEIALFSREDDAFEVCDLPVGVEVIVSGRMPLRRPLFEMVQLNARALVESVYYAREAWDRYREELEWQKNFEMEMCYEGGVEPDVDEHQGLAEWLEYGFLKYVFCDRELTDDELGQKMEDSGP